MKIDDDKFEAMISRALDELPEEYVRNLDNVAITYAEEPTAEQRIKMKLRADQSLFGLYEGIPLTKRGAGYTFVLPDKITIFKNPMTRLAQNESRLYSQVKHTLWHEIAHFYGLDHDRIHEIERRWQ
ncbi:MAG TPA: metallopeptidase family protein [Candidatus Saccharimonadales bacterium]|nr:metallopeptidase family protein [Candidatus Saccharimonadales bacterium]